RGLHGPCPRDQLRLRDAVRTLGIETRIGLHTGEVETTGEHLAAESGSASPGPRGGPLNRPTLAFCHRGRGHGGTADPGRAASPCTNRDGSYRQGERHGLDHHNGAWVLA